MEKQLEESRYKTKWMESFKGHMISRSKLRESKILGATKRTWWQYDYIARYFVQKNH